MQILRKSVSYYCLLPGSTESPNEGSGGGCEFELLSDLRSGTGGGEPFEPRIGLALIAVEEVCVKIAEEDVGGSKAGVLIGGATPDDPGAETAGSGGLADVSTAAFVMGPRRERQGGELSITTRHEINSVIRKAHVANQAFRISFSLKCL